MQCCAGGAIELHSRPHPFSVAVSEQPVASPLARWQARQGSLVTNRKHQAVQIGPFERHVLELLDGTRNLEQIATQLYDWSAQGRFQVIDRDQPLNAAEHVREAIRTSLPNTLASLAQNAFLVG